MKALEISEQEVSIAQLQMNIFYADIFKNLNNQAIQREESYAEQIKECTARLKEAEQRADMGERTLAKLQKEVDRLEGEFQSFF